MSATTFTPRLHRIQFRSPFSVFDIVRIAWVVILIAYMAFVSSVILEHALDRQMLDHIVFTKLSPTVTVGCPDAAISEAQTVRWLAYASNHGWTPYPESGALCVDP